MCFTNLKALANGVKAAVTGASSPPPQVTLPPQITLPADEFMQWLGFINPGMLHSGNPHLISHAIEHLPPGGAVVEIGSFAGLSINLIIYLMRKHMRDNPVYSVDPWHFEGARNSGLIPGSAVAFADYRAHVIDTFRRNVMLFSGDRLPQHIELESDVFFKLWNARDTVTDFFGRPTTLGGDIAMAYIDGNHTYEQSLKDFENIDRHLLSGGFVIFDDSEDAGIYGSTRTAQEVAVRSGYQVVGKNPNYCFQKQ